ncbi:MAG: glycosyltransferase family 4 protein [Pseudomonadota bacterium]
METGGAEKTALDIGRALVEAGHRSIVTSAGGRMVDQLIAEGSEHITLPLQKRDPISLWRNSLAIGRLLRQHSIDVVHARSRAPAWSCLWAARRTNTPFVTTYHGAYNQRSWFKAFYNSSMARSDVVIANSHWTGRLVAKRNPFAAQKVVPIARGTDFSDFDPNAIGKQRIAALRTAWGIDGSRPVILNLARLTQWKGQSVLIDAAAQVIARGANCQFILAGDEQGRTAYRAQLLTQIERLGLQSSVKLVGHCDDPAAAMKLADLAVVASVEAEAFGRAAVEASALETPVIVTKIGAVVETVLATPDVTEAKRTGWKVPPSDSAALARALLEALALKPDALASVGQNGRSYVMREFSLQQMIDKTLDVYQGLIEAKPR